MGDILKKLIDKVSKGISKKIQVPIINMLDSKSSNNKDKDKIINAKKKNIIYQMGLKKNSKNKIDKKISRKSRLSNHKSIGKNTKKKRKSKNVHPNKRLPHGRSRKR